MSKRAFEYYQYIAPVILTPLSFWLWWKVYAGDIRLVLLAWLLPILYAYIVPGIGTNVLKVWEFDTRLRLGRFRPHHGFVFGSATAMLAWACHFGRADSVIDIIKYSIVIASVLGLANIIYDIRAIRSGILKVYNQPWANRRGAEAIAMDYAPWFFAGFGMVYGVGIGTAELLSAKDVFGNMQFIGFFLSLLVFSIAVPVCGYVWHSFKTHGHSGCKPLSRLD